MIDGKLYSPDENCLTDDSHVENKTRLLRSIHEGWLSQSQRDNGIIRVELGHLRAK